MIDNNRFPCQRPALTRRDDRVKPWPCTVTLPRLPLPSLSASVRRLLEVSLLLSTTPDQHRKLRTIVEKFEASENTRKLRATLIRNQHTSQNWSYKWWLQDMYTRARVPLPSYSNAGYFLTKINQTEIEDIIWFASCVIFELLQSADTIDRHDLPQDRVSNIHGHSNLCMEQYSNVFGGIRIPLTAMDQCLRTGVHCYKYLVVIVRGNMFILEPYRTSSTEYCRVTIYERLLSIYVAGQSLQFQSVGLLTILSRDQWAACRQSISKFSKNRISLALVERSCFVVCLDQCRSSNLAPNSHGSNLDEENHQDLQSNMRRVLFGCNSRCCSPNRWFDKTIQFIVSTNGTFAVNFEHSMADGVVVASIMSEAIDKARKFFDVNGHPDKTTRFVVSDETRSCCRKLEWKICRETLDFMKSASVVLDRIAGRLRLVRYSFTGYARTALKLKAVSPDALVQVILQIAFYRAHHRLGCAYESASLRRFRYGRVDVIRSTLPEALILCQAMERNLDKGQVLKAFQCAINAQCREMKKVLTGNGIDNHFIALKCLSQFIMGVDEPMFSDPLYTKCFHFDLSTSQRQQVTTGDESFMFYGPVVDYGYGVCYIITADDIRFSISCLAGECTDVDSYRGHLHQALLSVGQLLEVGDSVPICQSIGQSTR